MECHAIKSIKWLSVFARNDNENDNTIIAAAVGGGVSLIAVIIIIVLCIKMRRDKEAIEEAFEENNQRMVAMKNELDEEKQKHDSNGGEYDDMDYPVQYE